MGRSVYSGLKKILSTHDQGGWLYFYGMYSIASLGLGFGYDFDFCSVSWLHSVDGYGTARDGWTGLDIGIGIASNALLNHMFATNDG